MKKIVSLLLVSAVLISCLTLLAGCGAPKDNGASIDIYLGNEVCDFDPSDYYADSTAEQVMALLYEPLFTINKKGKLKLAAASGYEVYEDERKIVIDIRETYWSDDVRVKADDFVYAWCERILDPNNPNPAAALFYDIENAMEVKMGVGTIFDIGVKATGVYELTIKYREGADYNRLLKNLASVAAAPLRQDIVDSAPTYWSKMINSLVTSGPFKVRTYNSTTKEFTLTRNLGYHQAPTEENFMKYVTPGMLENVFTAMGEEISVSYADIESKTTFFMCDASLSDRANHKKEAEFADDTSTYTYVYNLNNPLFAIKEVRQALNMAIDRDAIAAAITFGKAADGFLPDICGGSSEKLISTSSKLDEARELLSGVNFSGLSKSFTICYSDNEMEAKIAELVAQSWGELGFNVSLKPVSTVENKIGDYEFIDSGIQTLVKEASYGKRNFDVLGIDWQLYTNDAFVGLASLTSDINGCGVDFVSGDTKRGNIAGYSSTEYDSLLSAARTLSGEARAKKLNEAEKMLIDDAAVCPIVFNRSFAFISSQLRDVEVDGLGNFVLTEADLKHYERYLEQ